MIGSLNNSLIDMVQVGCLTDLATNMAPHRLTFIFVVATMIVRHYMTYSIPCNYIKKYTDAGKCSIVLLLDVL